MIRAFGYIPYRASSFHQRESFWFNFGRVIKNHLSNHSSKDNEVDYSESSSDTMDDLEDIFAEFDGDFDDITIFETGYDADTEDD